jgi:hypothetical protein
MSANTLPATSRTKLAKLLSMLGSDYAGERDAAALAAHRLVTDACLTWRDVLVGSSDPADISHESQSTRPPPTSEPSPWRDVLDYCIAGEAFLCKFDRDFLHDLANGHYRERRGRLSREYQRHLDNIVLTIRGALGAVNRTRTAA